MAVSLSSAYIMLEGDSNSLLYYDDAVSHLVIAKRVIDSLTPGIAQFGSVWLPMTHILLLPFTANNYLFQTGLAGTIVSGFSTAIAAVYLSRIAKLHFSSNYAGFLAASLFLMNSSVIYMSMVPMMEAPFMMFFMMASYYALNWCYLYKSGNDNWLQYRNILKCALAISAATLTRYEAWFFPIGLILLILIVLLLGKKEMWKRKVEAFVFIAAPYSLIGILVWTVYNGLIFRNPLLFFTGPYSAQAQSLTRPYRHFLFMHPGNAILTLSTVASDMYGLHVVLLSMVGAGIFVFMKRKKSLVFSLLTLVMLAFPIILDFAAMVQGSGEIYRHIVTGWFNGRYLIFVAPLFAFCSTAVVVFVVSRDRKILTISAVLVVLTFYMTSMIVHPLAVGKTTALSDGKLMPYRGDIPYAIDIGKALKKIYTGGRILDLTLSKSTPIMQVYSGVPLKDFIDVNNKEYWKDSVQEPWTHVDYAVLQKPVDHSNGVHINQSEYYDPIRENILYWNKNLKGLMSPFQPVGDSFLSSIRIAYQNDNFLILKNERKDLVLEKLSDKLRFPSNIAVVGKDDVLVAEKKTGIIHRIIDGKLRSEPMLDVNVATRGDRGVLGMTAYKNNTSHVTNVFLYYTQSTAEDGDDVAGYREPLGNRLYKYDLANNRLVNPKLLLDLPVGSPDVNNVGKIVIGIDKSLYLLASNVKAFPEENTENQGRDNIVVNPQGGQINITSKSDRVTQLQNTTSELLKISQDGTLLPINIQNAVANKTVSTSGIIKYQYDFNGSFGIGVDPVTGNIWNAGNERYAQQDNYNKIANSPKGNLTSNSTVTYIDKLDIDNVNGIDRAAFEHPKIIWNKNLGSSAISFVNTSKLGKQYENDLFVGDINNGSLYHFDLTKNRTDLDLKGPLTDRFVINDTETKPDLVLSGLGGITDIETGEDGYLYFSTIGQSPQDQVKFPSPDGAVYRLKALGG